MYFDGMIAQGNTGRCSRRRGSDASYPGGSSGVSSTFGTIVLQTHTYIQRERKMRRKREREERDNLRLGDGWASTCNLSRLRHYYIFRYVYKVPWCARSRNRMRTIIVMLNIAGRFRVSRDTIAIDCITRSIIAQREVRNLRNEYVCDFCAATRSNVLNVCYYCLFSNLKNIHRSN